MNANQALHEVRDALEDWASFLDTFEPEDRTDGEGNDRLFAYREEHALKVLGDVITAANAIIDGENDVRRGNVWGSHPYDIVALARALDRKLEPHPQYGDEG